MNNPRVSIIIPVFNTRLYLVEALESILHQSYADLEIIVVDDGSTDGSELLCDEYAAKDQRIRVVHQKNQGLSGARNTGLDVMTGDVVSFLDSDDAFHVDMIQRMLDAMIAENADIVTCKAFTCRTTESFIPLASPTQAQSVVYNRSGALRAYVDGDIDNYLWNKVYKRKCFRTIRFPYGHLYEDVDTIYRLLNTANRVVVLDEPLVLYRKRPGSITESYSVDSAKDRSRAYGHVAEFVKKNTPEIFTEKQKQKVCGFRFARTLELYAISGRDASLFRTDVLHAVEDVDLKQCHFLTRAEFFLFRYMPSLLITLYPPLRLLKKRLHSVRKRELNWWNKKRKK